MKVSKRLLQLIFQLLMLVLLLHFLGIGGISTLIGDGIGEYAKMVVELGVAVIALGGSFLSLFIKDQRQMIIRETQTDLMEYIKNLGYFQLVALLITGYAGILPTAFIANIPTVLTTLLSFGFIMRALIVPLNFTTKLSVIFKANQVRNSRKIIEDIYR